MLCLQAYQIKIAQKSNQINREFLEETDSVYDIFRFCILPIMSNAKEYTDEPIQKENYLPLLKLFLKDYKQIIAEN